MNYRTTAHARVRMQQRGISANLVRNILKHGNARRVAGGAVACYLSRKSLQTIGQHLPRKDYIEIERQKNVYVVVGDTSIITVGHRTKRFRN